MDFSESTNMETSFTSNKLYHPTLPTSWACGIRAPVRECETLVIITSDIGIAAHLSYLKQLIHGYNACRVRARRIYLVWQLSDIGKFRTNRSTIPRLTSSDIGIAAPPLLKSVLDDDRIDQGYVCHVLSPLLFLLT